MADIIGNWEFHRSCPSEGMTIFSVDSSGNLFAELGDEGEPIHGVYDANTQLISFNDARQPGDVLFVSFYTGYVMVNEQGDPCAMAGTWQEAELVFEAEARFARPRPPFPPFFTTYHSGFYAVYQGGLIQ
jgi:hypothetical protein